MMNNRQQRKQQHTQQHTQQNNLPMYQLPRPRWPWDRSLQSRIILVYGVMFSIVLIILTGRMIQVIYADYIEQAEHLLEVEAFINNIA